MGLEDLIADLRGDRGCRGVMMFDGWSFVGIMGWESSAGSCP